MTRTRSFVLSLIFFLFIAPVAHAQWKPMNGPSGGKVTSLLAIDTNLFAGNANGTFLYSPYDSTWNASGLSPNQVQALLLSGTTIFAATSGGFSLTNNFGTLWNTAIDSLYCFALTTSGSNVIMGTDNGIYISTDNGNDWTVTNDAVDQIYALVSVGSNVIAGSVGILISSDNGATWSPTNNVLSDSEDVYTLAVNGNDVFAGTADTGVFLSTDNGQSWNAVNNGLTDFDVNAIIAVGSKLFVGTQDSGIFLSLDNGATWLAVNDSFPFYSQTLSFATDGKYLYAGTHSSGVWRRPLAEMNAADGVAPAPMAERSIQAYPNPFTQSITIDFTSPESGDAHITIVNILGAAVAQVFSGELRVGNHSFSWNANEILPGMYECIVQMNGHTQQLPIILTR